MSLKTIVVCQARSGSQLLINALKESSINVAPRTAELFCGIPQAMPYPEILEDDFDVAPEDYWEKNSKSFHIDYAFERCELFKLLYHHPSKEVVDYIQRYPIIHLKRKNVLAQYVSDQVARKIGWGCNKRFNDRIHIDTEKFLKFREKCLERMSIYDNNKNSLDLWFEDGLHQNLQKIRKRFGIPYWRHRPETIKVVDENLSNVIENYKELKEYDICA